MNNIMLAVNAICLSIFVGIKVGGVTFAAWSWWWLLMPTAPVLAALLQGRIS